MYFAKASPYEQFIRLQEKKMRNDSSEQFYTDIVVLYFYLCRHYEKTITLGNNIVHQGVIKNVFFREQCAMMTIKDYWRERFRQANFENKREVSKIQLKIPTDVNSLSQFSHYSQFEEPELFSVFNTLWDISTLDNVPMGVYETEELSRSDMEDIYNIIFMHMKMDAKILEKYAKITILCSMIMRSFARMYHEVVDMVDRYSSIIETSDMDRALVDKAKRLFTTVETQKELIDNKQEKLNAQQLEIDRLRKLLREKETELEHLQEQNRLLKKYIDDESVENDDEGEASISIELGIFIAGYLSSQRFHRLEHGLMLLVQFFAFYLIQLVQPG